MIPLRDSRPTYKFPLFTVLLILANVFVFLQEFLAPSVDAFISRYALVPANIDWLNLATLYPFITSQFLHAGLIHLVSNMWFLRIFGDNVEERFGSFFYLIIYLTSGVVGGLMQYVFVPNSAVPMLGASGAVAGVLGAYLVFFPTHRIETLVPVGVFLARAQIPASLMLFYWFLTQVFSGVGSITYAQTGGVAWWAHVGGFATGWLFARLASFSKTSRGTNI